MSKPATWFDKAITQGLQALITLRLPNTPAADTISQTADVWVYALWTGRLWVEEQDAKRISKGFSVLLTSVEKWPAPKQLMDAMPPKPEPKKLAAPEPTAAQKAQVREMVDSLMAKLRA